MLLSNRKIETLPAKSRRYSIRAGNSMYLRVTPSGVKTFVYRYSKVGEDTWLTLGTFPGFTLADANRRAGELHAQRQRGEDPADSIATAEAAEVAARLASSGADTFQAVAADYFKRKIAPKYKCADYFWWKLEKHVLPYIGSRRVQQITRKDVSDLINRIVDAGTPVMANRVLADTKAVLKYAVSQGHIDTSPVALLTKHDAGGREASRERALSFDEVKTFLSILKADSEKARGVSSQIANVLVWLLLTGQRISEVLSAQWSHVDLKAGEWRIPKELTKSKREHLIHVTPQMRALLQRLPKIAGNPYVFASPRKDGESVSRLSVERALKRLFDDGTLAMPPFTPHDLRRTVTTRLGDLGVMPHVGEKIANHVMAGVMGIYNRAEYLPERKVALRTWNARVAKLSA